MAVASIPANIAGFLVAATPEVWLDLASERLPELLLDHANCELKAASTAIGMIYRYPERTELSQRMSRLAREELRHFEQVRAIMEEMSLGFERLSASRYAGTLHDAVRKDGHARLLDSLIVGALIEARSCERFALLAPRLPASLGHFYSGLLASEARHFEHYLGLAKSECEVGEEEFDARLVELKTLESELITTPDSQFRFHSGPPE